MTITMAGTSTTGVVSRLSIAKLEAKSSFIELSTALASLALTPEHHLPVVGGTCRALGHVLRDAQAGQGGRCG